MAFSAQDSASLRWLRLNSAWASRATAFGESGLASTAAVQAVVASRMRPELNVAWQAERSCANSGDTAAGSPGAPAGAGAAAAAPAAGSGVVIFSTGGFGAVLSASFSPGGFGAWAAGGGGEGSAAGGAACAAAAGPWLTTATGSFFSTRKWRTPTTTPTAAAATAAKETRPRLREGRPSSSIASALVLRLVWISSPSVIQRVAESEKGRSGTLGAESRRGWAAAGADGV